MEQSRRPSPNATPARVESTPLSVSTGFLGSGKTTTLAHLLADPRMARAAIEQTLHALHLDLPRQTASEFDVEGFQRFAELASTFR